MFYFGLLFSNTYWIYPPEQYQQVSRYERLWEADMQEQEK